MSSSDPIRAVALIGAGTMSTDIAAIFVARGIDVHIVSRPGKNLDTVRERIGRSVDQIAGRHGPPGAIHIADELASLPWQDIGLVIESVSEDLALKQRVFADLEKHASSSIPLTSNSSSFPISQIAQGLKTSNRTLGLHFFMPAHIVPLVEVVRSEATDTGIAQSVFDLMVSLGRKPVMVARDIPGFLANRMQHALMREAWSLIERGIASPQDVDIAVRYGFGFRYVAAGPILQKEMSGLDVNFLASSAVFPDLCNDSAPIAKLAAKVKAGDIGMKSGKGFYEWPADRIAAERKRYQTALKRGLEILEAEDDAG